jgi:hypothetical protein
VASVMGHSESIPPFQSRRRLLASVRGRRAGRHLMWSEGRESPSLRRSVAATTCPASSHPPSRRRDLRDQASTGLLDPSVQMITRAADSPLPAKSPGRPRQIAERRPAISP